MNRLKIRAIAEHIGIIVVGCLLLFLIYLMFHYYCTIPESSLRGAFGGLMFC